MYFIVAAGVGKRLRGPILQKKQKTGPRFFE